MKSNNLRNIILIQISVLIYSFVSVLSKVSSQILSAKGISAELFFSIGFMMFLLVVYAVVWQIILSKTNLNIAYVNKAIGLFWTMLWAMIIFGEKVTLNNAVGLAIIVVGIILVMKYE